MGFEVKQIDADDLNMPENPAIAPQIRWGEDFEAFDDKRKIIYLKKVASALNHATDLIQKERNELIDKCKQMAEQLENADKNVGIRKDIYVNAITSFNAEKQTLAQTIQKLERDIKNRDEILKAYGHNIED
jgi:septation ring formation regulator EzrA